MTGNGKELFFCLFSDRFWTLLYKLLVGASISIRKINLYFGNEALSEASVVWPATFAGVCTMGPLVLGPFALAQ